MYKKVGNIFLIKPSTLSEDEISFYRDLNFQNFIFFKEHFKEDFDEYRSFLEEKISSIKFLAVDQEGGRVIRIPGDYEAPLEIAKLVEKKGEKVFINWAYKIALSLKEKRLNLNLAPLVDLEDEGGEDFLRGRTFGKDPKKVIAFAENFIQIHKNLGIEPTLKHFPGLGEVTIDPHKGLPIIEKLKEESLYPFKELSSQVNFLMTTHMIVTSLDVFPTTFSEKMVKLIREECNFKGVILTDDLAMGALEGYELEEKLVRAIVSGHNLLIFTGLWEDLQKSLFEIKGEVEKSSTLKEKLKSSLTILESII